MTENIHLALRHMATAGTAAVVPLLGIPVFVEGTTLHMARGALQVADACSGFSTLYAAMAVAFLTAYSTPSPSRRALVLLGAAPIAIVSNMLRVILLVVLVVWRGPEILETVDPPASGMMTFALALPLIFWLGGQQLRPRGRRAPPRPRRPARDLDALRSGGVRRGPAGPGADHHPQLRRGWSCRTARSTAAIPTDDRRLHLRAVLQRRRTGASGGSKATIGFERRYLSGADEVLLTVLRSYDLKRLYHHPELDVAYGAGYLTEEIVELDRRAGRSGAPAAHVGGDGRHRDVRACTTVTSSSRIRSGSRCASPASCCSAAASR